MYVRISATKSSSINMQKEGFTYLPKKSPICNQLRPGHEATYFLSFPVVVPHGQDLLPDTWYEILRTSKQWTCTTNGLQIYLGENVQFAEMYSIRAPNVLLLHC